MSIDALNWAFERQIKGAQKAVLIVLADHANPSGECYPSVARIAFRAGITARGARKALRELETSGLVHTSQVVGNRSTYRLLIDTPTVKEPVTFLTHNKDVRLEGPLGREITFPSTAERRSPPPRNELPPNPQINHQDNLQTTTNQSHQTPNVETAPASSGVPAGTPLQSVAEQIESILGIVLCKSDYETLRWLLVDRRVRPKTVLDEIESRVERRGVDQVRRDMQRHKGLRTFVEGVFERMSWRRLRRPICHPSGGVDVK